jgi:hypothetical protein
MKKIISMFLILSLVSGCDKVNTLKPQTQLQSQPQYVNVYVPQKLENHTVLGKYLGKYQSTYDMVINASKELIPAIMIFSIVVVSCVYAPYRLYRWWTAPIVFHQPEGLDRISEKIETVAHKLQGLNDELTNNVKPGLVFISNNIKAAQENNTKMQAQIMYHFSEAMSPTRKVSNRGFSTLLKIGNEKVDKMIELAHPSPMSKRTPIHEFPPPVHFIPARLRSKATAPPSEINSPPISSTSEPPKIDPPSHRRSISQDDLQFTYTSPFT